MKIRFQVGDRVWVASSNGGPVVSQCPDCLGTCAWEARLPNGEVLSIGCPRCERGLEGSTGRVSEVYESRGVALPMTVGSIQTNTREKDGRQVCYMMEETGVGSGTLWYDELVFTDQASALEFAAAQAIRRNAEMTEANIRNGFESRKRNRAGGHAAYARSEIARLRKEIERYEAYASRHAKTAALQSPEQES